MIPQQFVITVALGFSLISLQYAEGLNCHDQYFGIEPK